MFLSSHPTFVIFLCISKTLTAAQDKNDDLSRFRHFAAEGSEDDRRKAVLSCQYKPKENEEELPVGGLLVAVAVSCSDEYSR